MARTILGIDPGSQTTGWGLVGGGAARPELLDCGTIRLRSAGGFAERLARLQRELRALIERLAPGVAAVESPFHGVSARAALQLAHARGVVLAELAAAGVEVVEYSPATIKKAVTGSGRADKPQVARMVVALLRRDLPVVGHDVSDAVAVALCHHAAAPFRESLRRARAAAAGGSTSREEPA